MPRPACIFIFNCITARISGHNFGPDALARKQCREHVLAALGCALAVPQRPRQVQLRRSSARGATAVRAGALEPPVNELIDTTFG